MKSFQPSKRQATRPFVWHQNFTFRLVLLLMVVFNLFTASMIAKAAAVISVASTKPHTTNNTYTVTDTSDFYTDTGSLSYAVEQADNNGGGTITFDPNLTASGPVTITLKNGGSAYGISAPITITGPGSNLLTIDAGYHEQIFEDLAGCTPTTCQLNLSGVTLANGSDFSGLSATLGSGTNGGGGGGGGAIYVVSGTVNLNQVSLIGNTTGSGGNGTSGYGGNGGNGGAIFNYGGIVTINNSTFVSNTTGQGGRGGSISGSYVGGNGGNGGAIYNVNGTVTISNSTFVSNTTGSGGNGGGISGSGGNSGEGAAIYSKNGTVNIFNSAFTSNAIGQPSLNATGTYNYAGTTGGAIYNDSGSTIAISHSTFLSNSAYFSGGAIYNAPNGIINNISDSAFTFNVAKFGGAIANSSVGFGTIANSTFDHNRGTESGGAIDNFGTGTISNIVNTTFGTNVAGSGNAIYNSGIVSVTNSTFAGTTASYTAQIVGNVTTNLKNNVFNNYSSGHNCGGNFNDEGNNFSDDATCNFSPSSNNSVANLNMGVLQDNGGTTQTVALLTGSAALGAASTNCPATDQRGFPRPATNCDAGAYQATLGDGVNTSLCTEANLNTFLSGGNYIRINCPPSTTITVTSNPDTTTNFRTISGTVTLDASPSLSFTLSGENTYQLFSVNKGGNLAINSFTLANGEALAGSCGNTDGCGGAVANWGTFTVTNAIFTNNLAGQGGAIYNYGLINVISNSTFYSNSTAINHIAVADSGGAIYNNATIESIANSTFYANSAPSAFGGAIEQDSGKLVSITNSTFYSNTASVGGGAISVQTGAMISNILNSTFVSNSQAIYRGDHTLPINFTNNLFAQATSGNNCSGFLYGKNNLTDDYSCPFNYVPNLKLDTLKDNGGPTLTIALLPGSPALNFASTNCPATDQRGQPRPQPAGTACDAGAFESNLQITPTITVAESSNPAWVNQNVTITATIAGNNILTPTGSLIFTNTTTNTPLGNAVLDASGNAVLTTTFVTAGNFDIAVGYSGNLTFTSAITNFVQTVNPLTTTLTLNNSPSPSVYGQPVTFTAQISPTAASDNVTFTIGSVAVATPLSGGTATYVTNTLPVGSTVVTATYDGDSIYAASTSNSVTQTVNSLNTNITVNSSTNPSVYGQPVTFTATIAINNANSATRPRAIGDNTVSFTIDGNTIATAVPVVNNTATYVTSTLSVGTHTIVANYTGSTVNNPSTSTAFTQTVNPANTTTNLLSSATVVTQGQSLLLTATVSAVAPGSGTPTGSVIFTDTTTNTSLGTISTDGSNSLAALVVNNLGVGNHTIAATYLGSGSFNSSTATTTVTVNSPPPPPITPTVTLSGSASIISQGQNIAFTVAVSGSNSTPSGTVSFYDNSTVFASYFNLNSQGIVTVNANALSVGTHLITATYNGNGIYSSANSNVLTITVNGPTSQTTPKITLVGSASVIQQGQSLSITATLTGSNSNNLTPTGSINVMDGGSSLLSVVSLKNGVATYTINSLSVGSHNITAIYNGDSNFNSVTSNAVAVTVNASSNNGYTYYLPFVANNANNFTTYLAFQNIGSASANITVTYYDNNGTALTNSTLITQVAKYAEVLPTNPFASGKQGTGIITSDQPLNVIVPEATPYGGSAYAVGSGSSNSLIAPFALNNAFGDFTTQLNIFNGDTSTVTATVIFYGTVGSSTTPVTNTTSVNISPFTTFNLNQNTLPSGFSGWAQITGSTNSLVAQVLEQSPSTKFVAIANAIANPSATEYAPAIFKNGYGSFYTGENIINPNPSAVTVTVTYYDLSANATPTTPFTIPGYGVASIFNGASGGNGLPSGGLPNNFIGSVAVSSVGGPIAVSVNENGGLTAAGNSRSGTYAAISSGSSTVGLPVVSNGGFTYTTGDTILNTSTQPVTATIAYYNLAGTPAGVNKSFTIAGHGSQAYYQGDGSLPSGFYGTAIITETSGPANALVVTTNAQNIALFYTYSEPNS